MRRSISALLLAPALVLSGLVAVTAPSASAVTVPKVMITGDSVAHQFSGDYTWRYRLWQEFQRQKKPVNFTGPFRSAYSPYDPQDNDPSVKHIYLGGSAWDSDHDAQGATGIFDFDPASMPGPPTHGKFDTQAMLEAHPENVPDVLVSMMGNNDVANALLRVDAEYRANPSIDVAAAVTAEYDTIIDDYDAFIAGVRSQNPDVKIVVCQVTSRLIRNSAAEGFYRDQFNARLAQMVSDLSTAESPIVLAQTDDPHWSSTAYTVDGIHTTPTGDLLMAQKVATAIHQIDPAILGTPAIKQQSIAWNPVITTSRRVANRRIYLNWGPAARANTVLGVRVKLVVVKTGRVALGQFYRKNSWNSGVLRPGYSYRVRIQGIRGNMISTWSPVYVLKVPKAKKKKN